MAALKLLNKKQIDQKLDRMAYQIMEDTADDDEIIIAGIADRGYVIAMMLKKIIEKISKQRLVLIKISIDKDGSSLQAHTDLNLKVCENKSIIVVDDVLNTGKSLTYGLGVFLNLRIKKLRTAVLVDRSHKLFPIESDFTGLEISTVAHEHVYVILGEAGKEDCVMLE